MPMTLALKGFVWYCTRLGDASFKCKFTFATFTILDRSKYRQLNYQVYCSVPKPCYSW